MSKRPQAFLIFLIIIAFASATTAIQLPYEVLDSIIELSDTDDDYSDLNRVNVSDDLGPTRPIYRLDLEADYVAYYEIDTGSDYVVLSSGRKTGDFREAESGPDPRPTDVVILQAQENGQQCEKFYRLSPLGLTICKNGSGTVVAASYNWTTNNPQIEHWRLLDQMVRDSLDSFKSQWRARAAQRRSRSDWATTEVLSRPDGKKKKKEEVYEEVLSPGSIMRVAVGERFKTVDVYVTNSGNSRMRPSSRAEWQQKLCKVLVNVCLLEGGTKINPSAVKKTPNHLSYLQLEVHGNHTFVGNALQWRQIGFAVEIRGPKNELVKKYFAINLQVNSKRLRRSVRSGSIPRESDFPDYYQHKCCGGCNSGCSPVAWAQVFGYYDRLGSSPSSKYSGTIYSDRNTKAPLWLTDEVKPFIEDIRSQVQTICVNGEGGTQRNRMHWIAPWFRARQGSKSRVVSYLPSRKKRRARANGGRIERGDHSWIASKGVGWLKQDYPVIFSIISEEGRGHSVVATKYKEKTRRYRHCGSRKTFGFWWKERTWRTSETCSWKTTYDYEFYLHYGWGGLNNKWQQIATKGAYVAYLA